MISVVWKSFTLKLDERLGHINLATPVAHIWFLKSLPSRIGAILDIALKDVERVLYSESYEVLDPGNEEVTKLKERQVISEDELDALLQEHGNGVFRVGVGAEAVQEPLGKLRIEDLAVDLRRFKRVQLKQHVRRFKSVLRLLRHLITMQNQNG